MPGKHPGVKYDRVDLLVPRLTPESAPVTQTVDLGEKQLEAIILLIPPGHAGLTGIQVQLDDVTILPWGQSSEWFIGEGIERRFGLDMEISGPFTVRAFNTDEVFEHRFYLTFEYRDLGADTDAGSYFGAAVVPIY